MHALPGAHWRVLVGLVAQAVLELAGAVLACFVARDALRRREEG